MRSAKISILGLYNADPDLFVNLHLPEDENGPLISKDVIVDNLLIETADMQAIYPDADFMKLAIGSWSLKEKDVWQKLYNTTVLEYNPIWNKDGTITETETISREGTDSNVRTSEGSSSGTSSGSEDETTHGSDVKTDDQNTTETLTVAGYNESTFQNREKTETVLNGSTADVTDGSRGLATSGETSDEYHDTNVDNGSHNDSETRNYSRTEQGNIGVTTTQAMIEEERKIDLFNLYDVIINSFKQRFCLLVY